MKYAIPFAAISLASCASTQTVATREPLQEIVSPKPLAEVSYCLAQGNRTPATILPDGRHEFTIKNQYGATGAVITLSSEGAGTRFVYRKQFPIQVGWKDCL
jgi:hypothetical protein